MRAERLELAQKSNPTIEESIPQRMQSRIDSSYVRIDTNTTSINVYRIYWMQTFYRYFYLSFEDIYST